MIFVSVLAAMLTVWLAPVDTAAQSNRVRETFQVAGWTGQAIYDNDEFSFCWIYSSGNNRAGLTLAFLQNADNAFFIAVSNNEWQMDPGENYKVGIVIDGTRYGEFTGSVYASNRSQAVFPLGNRPRLFEALRAGRTLAVYNSGRRFDFTLRGTSDGLARMRHCVNVHTGRIPQRPATIAEAPFGSPDPDAQHINGRFGANDMQALAEAVEAAGYRLVSGAERQENWPGTYHVWRGEGRVMGALISTESEAGLGANDKYQAYLEELRYSCQGTFSAAVYSRAQWGDSDVIRAIAACEENGTDYVLPFTLISHGAGAVIAIHFGPMDSRETLFDADNSLVETLRARYGS